ncbi:DUF397 domain-containing protein [Streptomyces albireticuli]|uniref:DUF397 domain-containing protein n=1 Tax=Streptomyces albireticuli TaxID=1940 RepID=UPI001B807E96|nr:DUF397 domain-containing protein [Streptomyces albireticuli]MCD9144376.1 DUF397 domain-containing protein [Streptomyces albireticuli]MCD9163561.1 DUF397 domain-containing protein [Streptomyces albireticuli]MCD9193053.1 DUF397 domain-containing protein [Streptomyces albireticuli]
MSTNTQLTALDLADETAWFKSSYSGDNTGAGCVSIAALTGHVGIRDSKQHHGPALVVPTASWSAFIREVRAGRLGR